MVKEELIIVCDTREQIPLWDKGIVRRKLETGDYSFILNGVNYSDKIAVERKSLIDLYGTLGKGHKRFKKELERSLNLDYFAIVIEGSYSSCYNKDFNNNHYSKMRGYVVTAILFTLHIKYGINIFFCNGRKESKRIIKELFNAYVKHNNNIKKE